MADVSDTAYHKCQEDECDERVPRILWTIVLNAAMLGIGIALSLLGPTLLDMAQALNVSLPAAGIIFTFRASGYLIAALLSGSLFDRVSNLAGLLLIPLLLTCIGELLVPFVTTLPLACFLFIFQGLSMGLLDVGGNVLLLTIWRGSKYINGLMHALHFCFGLGAFISPMVVGFWVTRGGSAVDVWYAAGLGLLPSCVGLIVLASSPQPKVQQEEDGETAVNSVVLLTGAFLAVYVGLEVTYGGYIDVYSVKWLHASSAAGAFLTSAYWGSLCLGRLVAAAITPYVNHTRYLAVHLLMAATATAILTWCTQDANSADVGSVNWWVGVVGTSACIGFAYAPLFPGAMLMAEELLGHGISGTAASIMVASAAVGEMSLPFVTGVLMSNHKPLFCWAQLGLSTAAMILFFVNGGRLLRKA